MQLICKRLALAELESGLNCALLFCFFAVVLFGLANSVLLGRQVRAC